MSHSEPLVLNPRLIYRHVLDQSNLLGFGEKSRFHRSVWQGGGGYYANDHSHDSEHQEHNPPPSEVRMINLLESI